MLVHGGALPQAFASADGAKKRIGKIADAIFRNAGDIDATIPGHIDPVSGFKMFDRLIGQAKKRKHAAVIGDEARVSQLLSALRALGVKIWLDDFGTGFSGLSHLRRVPMDGVKIDRSFVADLLRDPDDLALTTAIISMAHSIGITVVAEGVEKEGQFDVLRDRGCDLGQGFWLGHPLPAREFEALLR